MWACLRGPDLSYPEKKGTGNSPELTQLGTFLLAEFDSPLALSHSPFRSLFLCIDGLGVNLVIRTQHFLGRSSDAHDSPFSSSPGETFPSIDLCPRCRLSARSASTVHIVFLSQKEFSPSPFQLLVLACESGGRKIQNQNRESMKGTKDFFAQYKKCAYVH